MSQKLCSNSAIIVLILFFYGPLIVFGIISAGLILVFGVLTSKVAGFVTRAIEVLSNSDKIQTEGTMAKLNSQSTRPLPVESVIGVPSIPRTDSPLSYARERSQEEEEKDDYHLTAIQRWEFMSAPHVTYGTSNGKGTERDTIPTFGPFQPSAWIANDGMTFKHNPGNALQLVIPNDAIGPITGTPLVQSPTAEDEGPFEPVPIRKGSYPPFTEFMRNIDTPSRTLDTIVNTVSSSACNDSPKQVSGETTLVSSPVTETCSLPVEPKRKWSGRMLQKLKSRLNSLNEYERNSDLDLKNSSIQLEPYEQDNIHQSIQIAASSDESTSTSNDSHVRGGTAQSWRQWALPVHSELLAAIEETEQLDKAYWLSCGYGGDYEDVYQIEAQVRRDAMMDAIGMDRETFLEKIEKCKMENTKEREIENYSAARRLSIERRRIKEVREQMKLESIDSDSG